MNLSENSYYGITISSKINNTNLLHRFFTRSARVDRDNGLHQPHDMPKSLFTRDLYLHDNDPLRPIPRDNRRVWYQCLMPTGRQIGALIFSQQGACWKKKRCCNFSGPVHEVLNNHLFAGKEYLRWRCIGNSPMTVRNYRIR
jgi:hypothetical protein